MSDAFVINPRARARRRRRAPIRKAAPRRRRRNPYLSVANPRRRRKSAGGGGAIAAVLMPSVAVVAGAVASRWVHQRFFPTQTGNAIAGIGLALGIGLAMFGKRLPGISSTLARNIGIGAAAGGVSMIVDNMLPLELKLNGAGIAGVGYGGGYPSPMLPSSVEIGAEVSRLAAAGLGQDEYDIRSYPANDMPHSYEI